MLVAVGVEHIQEILLVLVALVVEVRERTTIQLEVMAQ
jgi:hypothetical protein